MSDYESYIQHPLWDRYLYGGRECRLSMTRSNKEDCGCCDSPGFTCTVVFLDNDETVHGVSSESLTHLPDHPQSWINCIKRAGWSSYAEYSRLWLELSREELSKISRFCQVNGPLTYDENSILPRSEYDRCIKGLEI